MNWVFSTEVTQREVPDIYRGRVGAIDTLAWMGAQSAAVAATAYASHEGIDFRTSVPWAAVLAVVLIVALNLNAMRRKTTSS